MDYYLYIALLLILSQLVFLHHIRRNYRDALAQPKKPRAAYQPRTALIVPCKGLELAFEKNIASFFNQDYDDYLLWFVVADKVDPAYDHLCRLKDQLSQSSKARDVQIFVAGQSQFCSQKIHNLLCCYERIGDDVEVMAFADSDVCLRPDWLSQIVHYLHDPKLGATSGHRWFVPKKNNLASLALSAINAKVVQLLGPGRFNQAWGGSMAIRTEVFRQVGLDKIWPKAFSDDLSLSSAVKKAGLKIAYVPSCLVASYESATWGGLLGFARRQFLITRISAPRIWWFALCGSLYSVLTLWGTAALAVYAAVIGEEHLLLFFAVPILFLISQMGQAILRQRMVGTLLTKDHHKMKLAMAADILAFWIWSLLLLFFIVSSAFGKTVCWRGICYKLLGPTETIIVSRNG
ncbi:MAG: glycosyltransferase [Planctomycetota bacterium]|jgi:cellulose synthase/poly-beta-1,6-N-acetylglucosamine synthase-like glycosyltransferase